MNDPRRMGAALLVAVAMLLCQGGSYSAWSEPAEASERKPDPSACNRAAFRVVLDVGHTAQFGGATSARGVSEFVFNLRLARLIEQRLIEAGFRRTVVLVTDGPAMQGLVQRVARANSLSADLFLSIHHDSVPNVFLQKWEFEDEERSFSDRFKGHSIFVSQHNSDRQGSLHFARLLGNQLKARGLQYTPHYTSKEMGNRRRLLVDAEAGVYRYDQLIVLRLTHMPAVLLEVGSIINRDEELLVGSAEQQALVSAAVTEAVDGFCALRRPRVHEQARRPVAGPAAKPPFQPTGSARSASPAKQR
jgi:N-acetylmuramoyl-L-alanine amidase